MSLNDNALTTWETAQATFKLPDTEQANVERLINAASQTMENYIGRPVKSETYTLDFFAAGGIQILPYFPIISIAAFTIDGVAQVVKTDYTLDKAPGIITLRRPLISQANWTITYDAGFASVPADLEQACLELVQYQLQRLKTGSGARQIQAPGGLQTQVFDHALPLAVKQTLDRYRTMQWQP